MTDTSPAYACNASVLHSDSVQSAGAPGTQDCASRVVTLGAGCSHVQLVFAQGGRASDPPDHGTSTHTVGRHPWSGLY